MTNKIKIVEFVLKCIYKPILLRLKTIIKQYELYIDEYRTKRSIKRMD